MTLTYCLRRLDHFYLSMQLTLTDPHQHVESAASNAMRENQYATTVSSRKGNARATISEWSSRVQWERSPEDLLDLYHITITQTRPKPSSTRNYTQAKGRPRPLKGHCQLLRPSLQVKIMAWPHSINTSMDIPAIEPVQPPWVWEYTIRNM